MKTPIIYNDAPETLLDSILQTFKAVFAGNSALFVTFGLLIVFTRVLVDRLRSTNYWGALTQDQTFVSQLGSEIMIFVHCAFSLAYIFPEEPFPTASLFAWQFSGPWRHCREFTVALVSD